MNCIVCESEDLEKIFCLNDAPRYAQKVLASIQDDQPTGQDVQLYRCKQCSMIQINPETLSHDDYWEDYLNSRACTDLYVAYDNHHASRFVETFSLRDKKILEVGCGDGYFLERLREKGVDVTAVEPSKRAAAVLAQKNIRTFNTYADENIANIIVEKFDGFACRQVLDLVKDPNSILRNVARLLKPGACGLVDVPSWSKLVLDQRYYSILPDRIGYFTAKTLLTLLEHNNFHVLEVFHGAEDEYVGAYFVYEGEPDGLMHAFNENFQKFQDLYRSVMRTLAKKRAIVAAWGAGAKGVTIFSMMKTGPSEVRYVVDKDSTRWNCYMPGSLIKIVAPDTLREEPVDAVIVTASMFFKEIVTELVQKFGFKGEIVLLTPYPRIVPADEITEIVRKQATRV